MFKTFFKTLKFVFSCCRYASSFRISRQARREAARRLAKLIIAETL
jgi:hypothetical protein